MKTETLSAAEWLAEIIDRGELTAAQKAALADWLRESPTDVRELIELTFIHQDLAALPVKREELTGWIDEARSMANVVDPFPLPQPSQKPRARFFLAAAAAVAVACLIGGIFLYSRAGLYATQFGEQRTLALADGSVVTLNTESRIKVEFRDRERFIKLLQGEAFFRVASDPKRPFLVSAGRTLVQALGTQFNVRMAPRDTIVSVVEGAVEVRDKQTNTGRSIASVQLGRGEEVHIKEALAGPKSQKNPPAPLVTKTAAASALHTAAWTQGRLEFDAVPLADVLTEFQRYREFKVEIDESIRDIKLTGFFDARDPDSALAYIATIPGVAVDNVDAHRYWIHRRQGAKK